MWEGNVDASSNTVISLAAGQLAPWFEGLEVGQTISIKYDVLKDGPSCLHIYDVKTAEVLAELNMNASASTDNEFAIKVDEEFLSNLTDEKIMIGGSGAAVTNVTLYMY
ncbi:MAG: hypothetical protein IKY36_06515 [Bacteroidales bacterium]|nr:hypothetical protein [Bacteroidales bacterium]